MGKKHDTCLIPQFALAELSISAVFTIFETKSFRYRALGDFGVTLGALKEPGLMSIPSDPLFMDLDMQEKHIILCLIPELALAE